MNKFVKILCSLFAIGMIMVFASCSNGDPVIPDKRVLNVWSFTDEVPKIVQKYIDTHPDCGFELKTTIVDVSGGELAKLDEALKSDNPPDIYAADSAFVLRYVQGDMSSYAATYEDLGISNVNQKIKDAEIAPYTVELGTRGNKVVALGYQTTGGAFIYRRSIAKDVWGTDEPSTIKEKIGGGTGNLNKFWEAAEALKTKKDTNGNGYKIISTSDDIWRPIANSSDKGWINNGKLYVDPKRDAFFDYAKKLCEDDYVNHKNETNEKGEVTYAKNCLWSDDWVADIKKDSKVFGYFGPAWLINYTISQDCADENGTSYGDWAVCESPVGFFWGGSWLLSSKDAKNKSDAAKVIEWITLDTSDNGLQYMWANGTMNNGVKDTVASSVVMKKCSGEMEFLGGQNSFPVFISANQYATGNCLSQYDEWIESLWKEAAFYYATGIEWKKDDKTVMPASSTKEEFISYCKTKVCEDYKLEE